MTAVRPVRPEPPPQGQCEFRAVRRQRHAGIGLIGRCGRGVQGRHAPWRPDSGNRL